LPVDTQANIKAQNPNATFGEVSKIVASMWDGLGEEEKQVHPPSLILHVYVPFCLPITVI
uniref:HMG box domain-containing protein n=1 Tax=Sander lucioperca TaxID=283035 RepID=A0A8D0B1P0_SANLU